jgi:uncharacterized phage protein (TIGR02218 family)
VAFEDYEVSVQAGAPVELYEFSSAGAFLRYTSAARDLEIDSVDWVAAALSRSEVEETADIAKSSLSITCPPDFAVSELFSVAPPDEVITLTVYRTQSADLSDKQVIWAGRVLNASWSSGKSELTCESVFTSLKRPGLRRLYGRNCQHALYGLECGVSQITFRVPVTLDTIDGITMLSPDFASFADGYFSGGKVEWVDGGGVTRRRGIKTHVGNTATITHPFTDIANGAAVFAFPGCDHTLATCDTKFSNSLNHGGFPTMGGKNPFGQSSVF